MLALVYLSLAELRAVYHCKLEFYDILSLFTAVMEAIPKYTNQDRLFQISKNPPLNQYTDQAFVTDFTRLVEGK